MPGKRYLQIAMAARIVNWVFIAAAALFGRQIVATHLVFCVWKTFFGFECATCGASRAVVSLLSGDFGAAVAYNPVVTLGLIPLFLFFVLSDLLVLLMNLITGKRRLSPLEYCFAVFEPKPRNANDKAGVSDE